MQEPIHTKLLFYRISSSEVAMVSDTYTGDALASRYIHGMFRLGQSDELTGVSFEENGATIRLKTPESEHGDEYIIIEKNESFDLSSRSGEMVLVSTFAYVYEDGSYILNEDASLSFITSAQFARLKNGLPLHEDDEDEF